MIFPAIAASVRSSQNLPVLPLAKSQPQGSSPFQLGDLDPTEFSLKKLRLRTPLRGGADRSPLAAPAGLLKVESQGQVLESSLQSFISMVKKLGQGFSQMKNILSGSFQIYWNGRKIITNTPVFCHTIIWPMIIFETYFLVCWDQFMK